MNHMISIMWFINFCARNGFGMFVDDKNNPIPPQQYNENGMPVDENGIPYSRSNKKKRIKKHYRGLKFHELRHTQATLLITNGVNPKTVQNRLGHASITMTLDLYAHASSENDKVAADLIGDLLDDSAGPQLGP